MRSRGSAAPTPRREKLSPRFSNSNRSRERDSWLCFPEGWGEFESVKSFLIPSPWRTRRRNPLSHGAHSPTVGVSAPEAQPSASAFQGRPGPRLRAAAGRRERSPRCPVALQVQALRPSRPRPSPAPWAGSQEPKGIDPSPRLPLTCRSPPTGWLLAPSGPPFPFPSRRVPPPARAGHRPRRSRIACLPARSPTAQRRGASGTRQRRGWARRLRAEVESGRGAESGECDLAAPRARALRGALG